MKVRFNGELRRIEKNEFKRRNGDAACDFNILLEAGVDSYRMKGSDKLNAYFDNIKTLCGCECEFQAEYHPTWKYNQFVITDINLV